MVFQIVPGQIVVDDAVGRGNGPLPVPDLLAGSGGAGDDGKGFLFSAAGLALELGHRGWAFLGWVWVISGRFMPCFAMISPQP